MFDFKINSVDLNKIVPLVDAINYWDLNHYDKDVGDYSATTLINPPRIVQLSRRHPDKLYAPLTSKINAFFGTAVHDLYKSALSHFPTDMYALENRVFYTIDGTVISGEYDILQKFKHVYDIKTCRAWKLVFDPKLEEWHQQQNIYKFLLHKNEIDVESLNIIAHYYDWLGNKALRDQDYPQSPVIEYQLDMWPNDVIEDYVVTRLRLHKEAEQVPDDELPECTPEERWERLPDGADAQYALFKDRKAGRAYKIFNTLDEAFIFGKGNAKVFGPNSFIEIRYGERKRCAEHCPASVVCNTYQTYLAKKQNNTLNDYIPLYL